jgi:hypothetical protein
VQFPFEHAVGYASKGKEEDRGVVGVSPGLRQSKVSGLCVYRHTGC